MLHAYWGDGKGKTCAAMGLVVRAAAAGWRVVVVQFLKDGSSSEISLLKGLPGVEAVLSDGALAKFTFRMSDEEKAASRALHDDNLRRAFELVSVPAEGPAACEGSLLVLDEALDALRAGLLDESLLRSVMAWAAGADRCEVVVTGHSLPDFVAEAADYLTRFSCERHPYQRGVAARRGIEY
mgnify:FL=1